MKILRLNLCGIYWHQIKAGTKLKEYRLASKWKSRIEGKKFVEVHLMLGYPKKSDESKILRRRWLGYTVETVTHLHFGNLPVEVLAIDVSQPVS
jgi:hypothetical protein